MRFGLLVAALLLVALPAWAQSCPRGSSQWTDPEYDAWRVLCAAGVLDVTPPYGRMEPPVAGEPLPRNVLSAAFLKTILTTEPYASAVSSLHLVGIIVPDVLDLRGARIGADVLFYDSHFLGGVVLDDLQAAGTWAFVHNYLPAPFQARNARIGGGFSLAESFAAQGIDIGGLAVGGDAVLRYLETSGLRADGLVAGGQLDLEQVAVASGELGLAGIRVGSHLTIAPVSPVRSLDLHGATVGGTARLGALRWSAPARLDLGEARLAALVTAGPLPAETGLPYRAMADALTAGGDTLSATAVLRRGLETERTAGSMPRRLWLTLRKWTTDYGTDPQGYVRAAVVAGAILVAAVAAAALWRRRRG